MKLSKIFILAWIEYLDHSVKFLEPIIAWILLYKWIFILAVDVYYIFYILSAALNELKFIQQALYLEKYHV